jgi:hypothetical protein
MLLAGAAKHLSVCGGADTAEVAGDAELALADDNKPGGRDGLQ